MRERRLGSQGPDLSVIGFGAWEAGGGSEWGRPPPEGQVLNAIRSVFDCGIDWIDTAEVYGRGRSEELVAKAVLQACDKADGADFTAEDEEAIRELAAFAGATLDALRSARRSADPANRLGRARQH